MSKTTGYYEVWQRPVRVGYYGRKASRLRHWWTGRKWQFSKENSMKLHPFEWYGLTEKAK